MTPPPIPVHLLQGDHPVLDRLLAATPWIALAVRLGVVPVLLVSLGAWGVPALATLFGARWLLARRRPRSCAAPLAEDAAFIGIAALLVAVSLGWDGIVAGLSGASVGVLAVVATLAAVWVLWGRTPTPVQMRQPTFRVLADNPATVTLVTKVRVEDAVIIDFERCADGPVSAVLYSPSLRPVSDVTWDHLRDAYEAGHATARLEAAPGRYVLSVRYYRPWSTWSTPVVRT